MTRLAFVIILATVGIVGYFSIITYYNQLPLFPMLGLIGIVLGIGGFLIHVKPIVDNLADKRNSVSFKIEGISMIIIGLICQGISAIPSIWK